MFVTVPQPKTLNESYGSLGKSPTDVQTLLADGGARFVNRRERYRTVILEPTEYSSAGTWPARRRPRGSGQHVPTWAAPCCCRTRWPERRSGRGADHEPARDDLRNFTLHCFAGTESYILKSQSASRCCCVKTPKLPGRLTHPPPAGMTEGARLLESEKPGDPRNRHALIL
jgi:hypothetical protein